jgi:MFS transporter, LPLT family, lysophospholipid transporter
MRAHRNYTLLLISQFLAAFGDNAVLQVILGQLTYLNQSGGISDNKLRQLNSLYQILLFVPSIALAPIVGYLNDRYAKTRWLVGGHGFRICGAIICAMSLVGGFWLQAVGYLMIGIGISIYGPAKYGILPEILPRDRLVKANGTVELLTLIAILSGVMVGSRLADFFSTKTYFSYTILIALYVAALWMSLWMTSTPFSSGLRFSDSLMEFVDQTRALIVHPRIGRALGGTALFWLCGVMLKINFQPWGMKVLEFTSNTQISLLFVWLSIGIMTGSILAGRWHQVGDLHRSRQYGMLLGVPVALLSAVSVFPLLRHPDLQIGGFRIVLPVTILLVIAGVIAGLFLVPLNAVIQDESNPGKLGKSMAVQNLTDNLGMLLAGLFCAIAPGAGVSSSGLFIATGAIVMVAAGALKFPAKEPLNFREGIG